jgi:hypothetical protein
MVLLQLVPSGRSAGGAVQRETRRGEERARLTWRQSLIK